jgi:hypothetical protein
MVRISVAESGCHFSGRAIFRSLLMKVGEN